MCLLLPAVPSSSSSYLPVPSSGPTSGRELQPLSAWQGGPLYDPGLPAPLPAVLVLQRPTMLLFSPWLCQSVAQEGRDIAACLQTGHALPKGQHGEVRSGQGTAEGS